METYRTSGRFAPVAFAWFVGALVVGTGVAWLYQRLVEWIPFIYLNLLLTLGFGFVLVFLVALAIERGKVRSVGLARGAAILVALAAWGASFWWAYRNAVPEAYEEVRAFAAKQGVEPLSYEKFQEFYTFDEWRQGRVEAGWKLGRATSNGGGGVSGVFVYLVWLIEGGILVVLSFFGAAPARDRPFCETCDRWSEPKKLPAWPDLDAEALRRAVRDEHRAPLLAPQRAATPSGGTPESGAYVLHACPACGDGGWVDVAVSRLIPKKKDKPDVKTDLLVRGLSLSSAERDALAAYEPPAPA